MNSSFYRVFDQQISAAWEWYKPSLTSALSDGERDHVEKGGLLLREIDPDYPSQSITRESSEIIAGLEATLQAIEEDGTEEHNAAVRLRQKNAQLAARVGELEVALEPFAKAAEDCIDEEDLDRNDTWEHSVGMTVTIGQFRVAQQALACNHEWVDMTNKIIESGEMCLKCGAIRAANRLSANEGEE